MNTYMQYLMSGVQENKDKALPLKDYGNTLYVVKRMNGVSLKCPNLLYMKFTSNYSCFRFYI